jgi:hypothetical protein
MQFVRLGAYLAVTRITGPSHNLLQIRLGPGSRERPECECLPAQGNGNPEKEPLDELKIVAGVLEGVDAANKMFGCKHEVTHIRYVEGDSRPESVYAYLATKIIEQLESGGEFIESQPVLSKR